MTNTLLDLSGKIDSLIIEVCEKVSVAASSMNIPYFVVGATARDLILTFGHGITTGLATRDIDFGIQVPDWNRYETLTSHLLDSGEFEKTRTVHRIRYEKGVLLDLVPFGSLAGKDHTIEFPPPVETKMSVLGFDDAYNSALLVRLRSRPVFEIRFASLAGLVVLKLIAWNDNRYGRLRDAQDIDLIMHHYADAGNRDRLINELADLLNGEVMDYLQAGVRLLGRDIAKLCSPETKKLVLKILDREISDKNPNRLIQDILKYRTSDEDSGFDEILKLLCALNTGMRD